MITNKERFHSPDTGEHASVLKAFNFIKHEQLIPK